MTVEELETLMRSLFDDERLDIFGGTGYSISFVVPGKVKDVKAALLARTDPAGWDGEAVHWFYRRDDEDWALYLRSIPHAVFCIATVKSLHALHIQQRLDASAVTPEQQAIYDAEEAQRRQESEARQRRDTRTEPLAPLGGPFHSDGERVWARVGSGHRYRALNHFDLGSFRHLLDNFAVDASGLRYYASGAALDYDDEGEGLIADGDAATLESLGGDWYRDARQAYYFGPDIYDHGERHLIVVKADVASLTHIGGAYARDAKHLFCAGVRKRGIDDPAGVVSLGFRYARLGAQILYDGKVVTKPGRIDVDTARGVFHDVLIDDDGHVLWGQNYRKPLPGIDAKSLRFLTRFFAVDDRRVYYRTNTNLAVCEGVDRASVEVVSSMRIRDRHGLIEIGYPEGVVRVSGPST
ncbi:DKNYY domain-containing protein [Burkholderia stabilis]|uniref:DKNYY domain-containing protein n=1 Tax=Burkholderia stabilis TaxID=95485 RepID=UPI00158A3C63|nr:DKNYY domain-containing protein [Burkholderia stabilis]